MRFLSPGSFPLCLVPLLLVTMLTAPSTAFAAHDHTCHPPDGGSHETEYTIMAADGPAGPDEVTMSNLTVRFRGDGSVLPHVTGTFVLPNRGEGQAVTFTAIALAESGGNTDANAKCADADGDSLIGLQSLTFPFRHKQTGTTVPITIKPETEIDSSGTYTFVVRGLIDDRELTFDATVRLNGSFGEVSPVD